MSKTKTEKSLSYGSQSANRFSNSDRDVEANRRTPLASPQTPTFPGATYGFNPSDQPAVPPRRVSSVHSLKLSNRSVTDLHTDSNVPPPLPSAYSADTSQRVPGTAHTANTAATDDEGHDNGDDYGDELAWGPSHPCFPHPNPHVPLDSPEYETTRIIRIRRDWMVKGDLAPTYSNIYPEILDPSLPEVQFRQIIDHINSTLLNAFDPFSTWNWLDGFLGLITGWLWEDFRPGGVRRQLRDLEQWMEQWNERVGWKDGVRLISLRRTAYLGLDIQIPDPKVSVVNDDDDDQAQRPSQQQRQQQPGGNTGAGTGNNRHSVPLPAATSQLGQFGHISSGPVEGSAPAPRR